jgi:protein-S-isoprenylcysteine O-methyltransferase Ste14
MLKYSLKFAATLIFPILYVYNILVIVETPGTINLPLGIILLGIILGIFGLGFWLISMINLRFAFGVLPQKQKRIKTGLYKYLRHPMYLGIWICFFGLSLANASWQGIVFLNLILTPVLFVRAYFEEKQFS